MILTRSVLLSLMAAALIGCASQYQSPTAAEKISDNGPEKQPPKTTMPVITYRPGG